MKLFGEENKKYWRMGLTLTLSLVAVSIAYSLLSNFSVFTDALGVVNAALAPVYIGLILAYLLSPVVSFFERHFFIPLFKKICKKNPQKAQGPARATSVILSIILAIIVVFVIIMLIIPQVVDSISSLVTQFPGYYRKIMTWVKDLKEQHPQIAGYLGDVSGGVYNNIMSWLKTELLPSSKIVLEYATNGLMGAVSVIINIFVGVIFAIYLLLDKERFLSQSRKLLFAVLPKRGAKWLLGILSETHKVFGSFIGGRLLDCLIFGIITFICIWIAGIPYALLISVFLAVTAIIPFFGAYIGVIPTALLVFVDSPMKGIVYLVIVIVLMQIDGNIIGPKILGDSIGLGSFWILFSIIVFGGSFGLVGMIVAVPVFAILYRLITRFMNKRLKKKELPTEAYKYMGKGSECAFENEPYGEEEEAVGDDEEA